MNTTKVYDNVNHPAHYTEGLRTKQVECIDITRHLSFDLGNAFKYVWRAGRKGDRAKALEDLEKALWYIDDWASQDHAFGEYEPNIPIARSVFDLLEPDDTDRYLALESLLDGSLMNARSCIVSMKKGMEE